MNPLVVDQVPHFIKRVTASNVSSADGDGIVEDGARRISQRLRKVGETSLLAGPNVVGRHITGMTIREAFRSTFMYHHVY